MKRTGTGTDNATFSDLDITGDMNIAGIGPGLTVIDATLLNNRIFDVTSGVTLGLSHATLTGGYALDGGAIQVAGGAANIAYVAFIGNESINAGGAMRIDGATGTSTIYNSLFTENSAGTSGGAIYVGDDNDATLLVGSSMFVNNQHGPSFYYKNIRFEPAMTAASNAGYNVTDDNQMGWLGGAPRGFFDVAENDYIGSPGEADVVVTTVADSYEHGDNAIRLSIREAVDLANLNSASGEQIWVPGWTFVLTRLPTSSAPEGRDISEGDIDVLHSMTLRGVNSTTPATSVRWSVPAADKVFELLGDYNGDNHVHTADYSVWQNSLNATGDELAADGNEDGVVDVDDWTIWRDEYDHRLCLHGLTVV